MTSSFEGMLPSIALPSPTVIEREAFDFYDQHKRENGVAEPMKIALGVLGRQPTFHDPLVGLFDRKPDSTISPAFGRQEKESSAGSRYQEKGPSIFDDVRPVGPYGDDRDRGDLSRFTHLEELSEHSIYKKPHKYGVISEDYVDHDHQPAMLSLTDVVLSGFRNYRNVKSFDTESRAAEHYRQHKQVYIAMALAEAAALGVSIDLARTPVDQTQID